VSVYFIDDAWRSYLQYDFKEMQPSVLFLTHAIFREFVGGTDEVLCVKTFAFNKDGHVFMEERSNLATDSVVERAATFSVVENWEEYPPFGDYARLCREERTKMA